MDIRITPFLSQRLELIQKQASLIIVIVLRVLINHQRLNPGKFFYQETKHQQKT